MDLVDPFRAWRTGCESFRRAFSFLSASVVACALAFLLSIGIALGLARARDPAPRAAQVAVWITDRDADELVGLDHNLLVLRSVAVRAPIEVEGRSDGGAWVAAAKNGDPLGRHELLRVSPDGTVAARAQLAPLLDLACDDQDRAAVVELEPGGARVRVFDAAATPIFDRAWPGALCAAARGNALLVGTGSGDLALFDPSSPGAPPLQVSFGGAIADVQPGPSSGSWWVLDSHAACRLALLDSGLGVTWSRSVGLRALHLAPVPGVERVWIADTTEPRARRFGAGGALELDCANLPLGGMDRACALATGGALFTAPGALLRLDGQGQNAPGQAGFDFLVDVALVP